MKEKPFKCKKQKDNHSRSIVYAVHGFWSGDNVRVTQSKDYRNHQWEVPQINWSCGGRDYEQEPSSTVAVRCFGKAIAAAVRVAFKWEKDMPNKK